MPLRGLYGHDAGAHHRRHRSCRWPTPLGLCSVVLGVLTVLLRLAGLGRRFIITLLTGAAVGLMNGCIVQFLRVPAFIATLGSGYVIYGLAQIIGKGDAVQSAARGSEGVWRRRKAVRFHLSRRCRRARRMFRCSNPSCETCPCYVWISLIIVLLMFFVRHKTAYGRNLSAFGFNAATAQALRRSARARLHVQTYVVQLRAGGAGLGAARPSASGCCAERTWAALNYTFEIVTAAVVAWHQPVRRRIQRRQLRIRRARHQDPGGHPSTCWRSTIYLYQAAAWAWSSCWPSCWKPTRTANCDRKRGRHHGLNKRTIAGNEGHHQVHIRQPTASLIRNATVKILDRRGLSTCARARCTYWWAKTARANPR